MKKIICSVMICLWLVAGSAMAELIPDLTELPDFETHGMFIVKGHKIYAGMTVSEVKSEIGLPDVIAMPNDKIVWVYNKSNVWVSFSHAGIVVKISELKKK